MHTTQATVARFLPQTLRQYAFLGDGERGALIGPHGNIVWMCAPRCDSDAVFSSLLGGTGGYAITPTNPYVWGGHYEPRHADLAQPLGHPHRHHRKPGSARVSRPGTPGDHPPPDHRDRR